MKHSLHHLNKVKLKQIHVEADMLNLPRYLVPFMM